MTGPPHFNPAHAHRREFVDLLTSTFSSPRVWMRVHALLGVCMLLHFILGPDMDIYEIIGFYALPVLSQELRHPCGSHVVATKQWLGDVYA